MNVRDKLMKVIVGVKGDACRNLEFQISNYAIVAVSSDNEALCEREAAEIVHISPTSDND